MKNYRLSIRCYFEGSERYTHHMQDMPLKDITKWVEAYRFTHPAASAVTIRVPLTDENGVEA